MTLTMEKAVTLPVFDGKQESFQVQWLQLRAYARLHQFSQAIGDGLETDMPEDSNIVPVATTAAGKAALAAIKRNDTAMAVLTIALKGPKTIHMVVQAKTEAWPEGEAHKVIAALMREYKPTDVGALASW